MKGQFFRLHLTKVSLKSQRSHGEPLGHGPEHSTTSNDRPPRVTHSPHSLSSSLSLLPTYRQAKQEDTMPHALFRKQHLDVRELDLSTIVYSSNDPEHLPNPKLNYTPVPDEEALELLTEAFNRHPDRSAMMTELSKKSLPRAQ